jgi:hypothetical protein
MPPAVSALLAFVASLFRSKTSLRLENLAPRHQFAVYRQKTIARPRLYLTDRLIWVWLSRLSGYVIYVGLNGRTHVFIPDGRHHTGFRTTRRNRQQRVQSGRWIRVQLQE